MRDRSPICRCVIDEDCATHRVDIEIRALLDASRRASDRMFRALVAVLVAFGAGVAWVLW